ncbi:hypothetical protein [Hyphomicrobium sp.]|uniref:hypothetical protein n=1 Tax=Hyphomicrobium sp. TaxID=82 RepID=UPI0025C6C0BF|nr:hypothetical protein [Hyphomicrobium sp.]
MDFAKETSPHEGESYLSRHSARKTYDFCAKLVPKRPQLLIVEFERILGEAGERRRPLRICYVDASASVTAVARWECNDLQVMMSVLSCDAHRIIYALDCFRRDFARHESLAQFTLLLFLTLADLLLTLQLFHFRVGGDHLQIFRSQKSWHAFSSFCLRPAESDFLSEASNFCCHAPMEMTSCLLRDADVESLAD